MHLRRLGLAANLGSGKTEAVLALHGRGSRQVRRQLFGAACPTLDLARGSDVFPPLRLVPSYVHLGTVLNSELSEVANLKRRAGLLASAFKPIRNRLLNNPFLLPGEKRELILGRVIPCFLHGSGLWRLATAHEKEAAVGPLHSVFRQCIRPITGNSSAKMTQTEVLAALDLPSPEELLHVHRARAFLQVFRADMQPCWTGFQADSCWLRSALASAQLVCAGTVVSDLLEGVTLADLPQLSPRLQSQSDVLRAACRRFLKRCRSARPPVDWAAVRLRQQQGESMLVLSSGGPGLPHQCGFCTMSYASHRRLSVHLAKCHGIAGKGRAVAQGTACEVCGLEFWSTQRLASHLARSKVCHAVYSGADLDPEPFKASAAPAWRPCMPRYGPQPWWASLRPP